MARTKQYSRYRRDFGAGALAAVRWIANPISEDGAKQVFRIVFATLGPEVHRGVERMRERPELRTLLDERPDLGATLADMKTLAKLPEGSLGRVYHDFMAGDDIFPGYIIGGLAYKNGHFDRLVDWDPDAKWLLERIANTHDITHVLGGYGSDFAGEAINMSFAIAAMGAPPAFARLWAIQWGLASSLAIQPPIGVRAWVDLHLDAVRRGCALARKQSLAHVPFERNLDVPIEVFRRRMGVPSHRRAEHVTADGWLDSREWTRGFLGQKMADGFGTMDDTMRRVRGARRLIESGVPIRAVMSSRRQSAERAFVLHDRGEPLDRVMQALTA
jgi:ubiquinone biosynthesis protein COQ4